MAIEKKLEDLNLKLESSITKRVAKDEMYQKIGLEFLNEKGEVFFKAFAPESLDKNCVEDWELNTIRVLEIQYNKLCKTK